MTAELMTSAVCWEHGAAVSVDFGNRPGNTPS